MNQSSFTSPQDVVKSSTTLDKIPEDVQLAIIRSIQVLEEIRGIEAGERKGAKVSSSIGLYIVSSAVFTEIAIPFLFYSFRARDSALRAVALSCRKLLSVFRPELLANVTVNNRSIVNFYLALVRNPELGNMVRSITFTDRHVEFTQEEQDEVEKDLSEIGEALEAQGVKFENTISVVCIAEGVYHSLPYIETLVIQGSHSIIPIQSKWANARLAPLPFLNHSLKKLFIPLCGNIKANLKARNVVWLLIYCTGLRSASLRCLFDEKDFKYLAEFSDTFSGLSEVQELSLGPNFSWDKSSQRYWDAAIGKEWIGGSKKSQAVFHLLKVTKNLQCLEITNLPSAVGELKSINDSCLSALKSSLKSLKHLRLLEIEKGATHDDSGEYKANVNFSLFSKLEVISFDAKMLEGFARSPEVEFPPSLKILCIPYYHPRYSHATLSEDLVLARIFKVKSFPNLETVIVPSKPVFRDGTVSCSDEFKLSWLEGRRELEKAEIFTSGKVQLRLSELDEFSE